MCVRMALFDWLFTRLNNWLWFSGFYGGLFFSSFISSGDAAFIHAWALPAICYMKSTEMRGIMTILSNFQMKLWFPIERFPGF